MTIWRWTPGDKAVVPATELPFTYRISIALVPATELSLLWRHISPFKNIYDVHRHMYIYTGYLRGKKITVFLNLNLCIYKYMNNEYVNIKINMYIYVHILYMYIYNMYMYNKNKNLISVYIYIVRYIHIVYTVF